MQPNIGVIGAQVRDLAKQNPSHWVCRVQDRPASLVRFTQVLAVDLPAFAQIPPDFRHFASAGEAGGGGGSSGAGAGLAKGSAAATGACGVPAEGASGAASGDVCGAGGKDAAGAGAGASSVVVAIWLPVIGFGLASSAPLPRTQEDRTSDAKASAIQPFEQRITPP